MLILVEHRLNDFIDKPPILIDLRILLLNENTNRTISNKLNINDEDEEWG